MGAIISGDCFRHGVCLNLNAGVYASVVSAPLSGSAVACLDTKTICRGAFVDGISEAVLIADHPILERGEKQFIRYWLVGDQANQLYAAEKQMDSSTNQLDVDANQLDLTENRLDVATNQLIQLPMIMYQAHSTLYQPGL